LIALVLSMNLLAIVLRDRLRSKAARGL